MFGYWPSADRAHRLEESRRRSARPGWVERVIDHTGDIARPGQVEALENQSREERNRCGEIGERTARPEAFQAWAEPLLERAVKAIETANAFRPGIDERP